MFMSLSKVAVAFVARLGPEFVLVFIEQNLCGISSCVEALESVHPFGDGVSQGTAKVRRGPADVVV